MPWIFKISRTERWRRNFQIRSDYVFHHCSSTWMFSHSVLWNAATLRARYPFHPPPSGCIIIYCFHCCEGRKQEKIVLVVLFTTRSDIQFSRQTGHTFICVVMANPCPPTAKKQVNKKRNSFSLQSTLHSAFFLSLLIYLKVLIASNRRDWKEGNICMARRNIISLLITGRRLSLHFKRSVFDSNLCRSTIVVQSLWSCRLKFAALTFEYLPNRYRILKESFAP